MNRIRISASTIVASSVTGAQSAMSVPLPPSRRLPRSLYLHIPFCRRRCFYCDFPVVPLGDGADGSRSGSIRQYLELLHHDLEATPAGPPLSTVYIGGGTPSLLTVEQLQALLAAVRRRWRLAPAAEVTLEMDPGSFDEERLQGALAAGVNRVSLGGQSFDDAVLAGLGRSHRRAELLQSCRWLRQARAQGRLRTWSLDLIVNLPGQADDAWETTLAAALAEQPPHLSIYDLIVEPGTVFARAGARGALDLPDEDAAADRLIGTHHRLAAAGYGHYEISSWALPGHGARHNRTYWTGAGWWACGLGATAGAGAERLARPRTREAYAHWLQQWAGAQGGDGPPWPAPPVEDLLLVGLRCREGVSLGWLARARGITPAALQGDLEAVLAGWRRQGLVAWDGGRLRLLPPEGFCLSNAVLRDLLAWWQPRPAECAPGPPSPAGCR
jgi:oxygen-independent coproporphyrinogen-3 oxidase